MVTGKMWMCLLFSVGVYICAGNLVDSQYKLDTSFNDKMCLANIVFEISANNVLRCISLCPRDSECKSIIHVKSANQCFGINLYNPCPDSATVLNGAKFYKKKIVCGEDDKVAMVTGANGIDDPSITASSWYDNNYMPHFARLNGARAWATPGGADVNQYIQFDFGFMKFVKEIATRGFCCPGEWVQSYMLLRSEDCSTYTAVTYLGSQIFPGNSDTTTVLTLELEEPFYTRCIRLNPRSWQNWATIQVEFYGCPVN